MNKYILTVCAILAVVLGVKIGERLTDDEIAIITGMLCGISACIPFSVALIVLASRRYWESSLEQEYGEPQQYIVQQQPNITYNILVLPDKEVGQTRGEYWRDISKVKLLND
jgi:hypothetical protein